MAYDANNPFAGPQGVYDSEGKLLYWEDQGGYQITPDRVGFLDEGNPMGTVSNAIAEEKLTPWDRLKRQIFAGRGMTRQQVDLDSLAPEDKAKLESMWQAGQLTKSRPWEAPNSYILRALGEEGAAKYGITPQSVKYDNIDSAQAHELRKDQDFRDNNAMNKQALITIGSILAGGLMFGGETAGAAAGAGETGAATSGAGYTGTAAELAADGLGGVDMWGSFGAGDAAAGAAGTAYYDSGAGMWVDSATGQGISSGASVPSGYTAAEGSAALAAGDAAPGLAGAGGVSTGGASTGGTSAANSASNSGLLSEGNVKAAASIAGGLLGSVNGAKQAGTTTTTTAPWTSQQPYLLDVFKQAKAASQGSPLTQKANENYASVLAGPTSNPMLGLDNPYLQQSIDYANQDVSRAMLPAMTAANRASGSYGNSGVSDIYSKGLLDAYSRNATGMRMTDYTNQQNLQQQAVNNTLNYTQNANQWNAQPSQLYGQTVQGNYGSTSSTPYYENKYANILGGISTGLGLYNAYKGSQ